MGLHCYGTDIDLMPNGEWKQDWDSRVYSISYDRDSLPNHGHIHYHILTELSRCNHSNKRTSGWWRIAIHCCSDLTASLQGLMDATGVVSESKKNCAGDGSLTSQPLKNIHHARNTMNASETAQHIPTQCYKFCPLWALLILNPKWVNSIQVFWEFLWTESSWNMKLLGFEPLLAMLTTPASLHQKQRCWESTCSCQHSNVSKNEGVRRCCLGSKFWQHLSCVWRRTKSSSLKVPP